MEKLPKLSIDLIEAAKRSDGVLSTLKVEEIKQIAQRYRKFLFLADKYPSVPIAPTHDIDEMWHLHMLHPRYYYNDCMNLFGNIMDHNAGFGKTASELPVLNSYGDRTAEIWQQEFDEEYHTDLSKRLGACHKGSPDDYDNCHKHATNFGTCYKDLSPQDSHYGTCYKDLSPSYATCYDIGR